MLDLFVVILFLAALLFWWDSLGARESARVAGKRACEQHQVQLLDDTVAIDRLRVKRSTYGRLQFYREYRFEFSYSGEERSFGRVVLLGRRVLNVDLALREF